MPEDKAIRLGHPSYVWGFGQERRLDLIRRYATLEGRRILDVGCGLGTYVQAFTHMRQVFAYALHRGYFVRKFPETSRRFQYFIPSLFVIGLVLGLIGSFFHPAIFYTYISVVGLYLLLVLASSIKTIDLVINAFVFLGIILTNLTYGVGFLRGLFARRIPGL